MTQQRSRLRGAAVESVALQLRKMLELIVFGPGSLRVKLHNIRSFVVRHIRDIRAIVNSDAAQTRAIFAKHIEEITLTPNGERYFASGTWDFVGRGSFDGAGGPVATERHIPSRLRWLHAKQVPAYSRVSGEPRTVP
jgi:hypothetical protein